MTKNKMSIDEAETIIDDMYQDKYKIMSQRTNTGVAIDLSKMDEVTFTNLEFASVRALREVQSLRHKIEKENRENTDYKRVLKENEKQKELIEKMKNYLLKENKMCDFLESEEQMNEEEIYKMISNEKVEKYPLLNEIFAIRDNRHKVDNYTICVNGYISLDVINKAIKLQKAFNNSIEKINKIKNELKEVQEDFLDYCPDCVDLAEHIIKILEE